MPTADTGTLNNCYLPKVSHASDCEKCIDMTFMERPHVHLAFQFWHMSGFGFGVALVNLVNSSGGEKIRRQY